MTVSVVIPAARGNLCQRLIISLQRQTLVPDEILAVGNEATDLDWADMVRYSTDAYWMGGGDVCLRRNIGIWEATGDIIIFQDDDQMAPPDMVESAVEVIEREQFVWGHHRYIDFGDDPFAIVNLPPDAGRSRESEPNRRHLWYSCFAGMMGARRDLLISLGGFDMAFQGRTGNEDQQFGRRMLFHVTGGDSVYIYEPPFAWHPTDIESVHGAQREMAFDFDKVMTAPYPVLPYDPDLVKVWRETE